jgi:hypothetical protein
MHIQLTDLQKRIIATLTADPGLDTGALARELDAEFDAVQLAVCHLVVAGRVEAIDSARCSRDVFPRPRYRVSDPTTRQPGERRVRDNHNLRCLVVAGNVMATHLEAICSPQGSNGVSAQEARASVAIWCQAVDEIRREVRG